MKQLVSLTLAFFVIIPVFMRLQAQVRPATDADTTTNTFDFIKDDFIAASLDSLAALRYFEGFECPTDETLRDVFGFTPGFVPVYADSVYYSRLKKLDAATPINLTYNQYVRDYIELYATKKRVLMQRVMGLAQIYFPMFEEQLDRHNMPLELKYLAIVESALNPVARSRVGATGLWQFMYGTGKMYNLNVTSLVDDRRDPLKATIAACEHMNDLYKMYGDWLLVLAAYNSGAGNVNKAIRRSGGKMDFWQIRPFLPMETRGYVPAFIAVNYVMSYAAEHNLRPVQPLFHHFEIDTVVVKDVLSFKQISTSLNIPEDEIAFLNPAYKSGVIPATKDNTYILRLQKKYIGDFVNNEARLYAINAQARNEKEEILSMMKTVTQAEYHKVKKGESLGVIARKYHCSVEDLKRWNKLRSTNLQIGQRLIVRPEVSVPANYALSGPKTSSNAQTQAAAANSAAHQNGQLARSENVYHKVKAGETLGKIASSYNTTVANIQSLNNLSSTNIKIGENLIVARKQVEESSDNQLAEVSADKEGTENADTVAEYTASEQNKDSASVKVITKTSNKYHQVKSGETLGGIAERYKTSVSSIRSWNNIQGNIIRTGQKLVVGKTTVTERIETAETQTPDNKGSDNQNYRYYTVQQGDTLWKIAQKYEGVTVEEIKKLNNIINEKDLRPGQKIKLNTLS